MFDAIQLSDESIFRLQQRHLQDDEISQFAALLEQASQEQQSAKHFLASLSPQELDLVQRSHSLAQPIHIEALSEEGATNLLRQPDHSDSVDLNNDGLLDVGSGQKIVFPPINAPESVKLAWEQATEGLSTRETMMLTLTMHHMVYGVRINGQPSSAALSPPQQWRQEGIQQLMQHAYSNLDFRLNLEGLTEHNLMLKQFYQRFESALNQSNSSVLSQNSLFSSTTNNQTAREGIEDSASSSHAETSENDSWQEEQWQAVINELNQLLLDARLGLDREKLEEIEKKMEAVLNDKSLTGAQRQQKLEALLAAKELIIEQARERTVEMEKQKARLHYT